jgi:hypothetical protein
MRTRRSVGWAYRIYIDGTYMTAGRRRLRPARARSVCSCSASGPSSNGFKKPQFPEAFACDKLTTTTPA